MSMLLSSQLHPSIKYPNTDQMDPADIGYECDLYKHRLLSIPVVLAIGKPHEEFAKSHGIRWWPVYLVTPDSFQHVSQIGVHESLASSGDPTDLTLVLNKYATRKLFTAYQDGEPDEQGREDGEKPEDKEPEEQGREERETKTNVAAWLSGTYTLATDEAADAPANWLQKFLRSNQYAIEETAADHTFMSILARAYLTVGMTVSVAEVRNRLAQDTTVAVFQAAKRQYDVATTNIKDVSAQSVRLVSVNDDLKNQSLATIDRDKRRELREQQETLRVQHEALKQQMARHKRQLVKVKHLKEITTVEEFRQQIRAGVAPIQEAELGQLERLLRVKFILFRQTAFKDEDMAHVIYTASDPNMDPLLKAMGQFYPQWYVMLATDLTEKLYYVCTYRGTAVFKPNQLPKEVITVISNMCLEQQGGAFALIPPDFSAKAALKSGGPAADNTVQLIVGHKLTTSVLAGHLGGEQGTEDTLVNYATLDEYPQWRQMLDDSWEAPIQVDQREWPTVDHYVVAMRYQKGHPEVVQLLSTSADDDPSDAGKPQTWAWLQKFVSPSGKYKKVQIRPPDWVPDSEYLLREDGHRLRALTAKFQQHPELVPVLKATKTAHLSKFVYFNPPTACTQLMDLRKQYHLQG